MPAVTSRACQNFILGHVSSPLWHMLEVNSEACKQPVSGLFCWFPYVTRSMVICWMVLSHSGWSAHVLNGPITQRMARPCVEWAYHPLDGSLMMNDLLTHMDGPPMCQMVLSPIRWSSHDEWSSHTFGWSSHVSNGLITHYMVLSWWMICSQIWMVLPCVEWSYHPLDVPLVMNDHLTHLMVLPCEEWSYHPLDSWVKWSLFHACAFLLESSESAKHKNNRMLQRQDLQKWQCFLGTVYNRSWPTLPSDKQEM